MPNLHNKNPFPVWVSDLERTLAPYETIVVNDAKKVEKLIASGVLTDQIEEIAEEVRDVWNEAAAVFHAEHPSSTSSSNATTPSVEADKVPGEAVQEQAKAAAEGSAPKTVVPPSPPAAQTEVKPQVKPIEQPKEVKDVSDQAGS